MGDRNANSHCTERCVSRTTNPDNDSLVKEGDDQSASVDRSAVLLEGSVELDRHTLPYWLTVIFLAIAVTCIAGVVLFFEVV